MKENNFWGWYGSGLLRVLKFVFSFRWITHPGIELVIGINMVGLTIALFPSLLINPLWLILTIPAGVTLIAHGFYRFSKGQGDI